MKVVAVVMAGGLGTRLVAGEEKPMVKCGDKAMIDHVLEALKNCSSVSETFVATSANNPKTEKHVQHLGFRIIKTSGLDYVSDLRSAVKYVGEGVVLVVGADLPLMTSKIIENVIERFKLSKKPTLSVHYATKMGSVPIGLNLFRAEHMTDDQLGEEVYASIDENLSVNVNTLNELKKAEALLKTKSNG